MNIDRIILWACIPLFVFSGIVLFSWKQAEKHRIANMPTFQEKHQECIAKATELLGDLEPIGIYDCGLIAIKYCQIHGCVDYKN